MPRFITFSFFIFLIHTASSQSLISCGNYKNSQLTSLYYVPENLRSDTFDVLKYSINLDVTDFTNQTIKGYTAIRFTPKMNNQTSIRFDLLQMQVDSIKLNNALLSYSYNDTLLSVQLGNTHNVLDTSVIKIYYHGQPQGDPSGWGGFSFSGTYAYNLGVGFGAKPHNYGRVWFPCFDNFVEKSKYEFFIKTELSKTAYCNGFLNQEVTDVTSRTRHWILNQEIPTYLASVAVADYTEVRQIISGLNGTIPVILAARAADTTALKNGFIHLPDAVHAFENYYGPYLWNRVGYCLVPFSSGAMEHATNIAYPRAATSLSYETLMAHELSHHWWGNLVTCETQEDIWINEGMANYSEFMFTEWTYSYDRYITDVKAEHDEILRYGHLNEKGFRAISGIPHQYTYGDHVYIKGADVAHTLRSYMGDAAFFNGLKYILLQRPYKNINSHEFKTLMETSSGQSLGDFFNNWVLNGGWPHFSIDSVKSTGTTAPFTSVVYVKQKLTGAPNLYSNVPLEIQFMNNAWSTETKTISMSGATKVFTLSSNIAPAYVAINFKSKISDAVSSEYKTIKNNTSYNYNLAKALLTVTNKGQDSSLIRVEHNITAPDAIKNNANNYRLNTQHYWKIDGLLSSGFHSKLRLNYDGNKSTSGIGYMDTCLILANADSLILLYRKNAADDWQEVKHYTKTKFTTKTGMFNVDTLKLGEYVFANGKSSVIIGLEEKQKAKSGFKIIPNPAKTTVEFVLQQFDTKEKNSVEVYDVSGKLIFGDSFSTKQYHLDVSAYAKGIYKVLINSGRKTYSESMVIE